MTRDQFRRLALGLPDATESSHMGHPDFRIRNKIFATLHPDGRHGMVKLTPGQQADLLELPPGGAFFPSAGAWGRQGCTNVLLEAADRGLVAEALRAAWRNAAPKTLVREGEPHGSDRPARSRPGGRRRTRSRRGGQGGGVGVRRRVRGS